jgi:hypothetical protein
MTAAKGSARIPLGPKCVFEIFILEIFVAYVGQVVRAGQLHFRTVSRASVFKLNSLGAGQSNLSIQYNIVHHFHMK